MSYTPPAGHPIVASWVGASPYTAPGGHSITASWLSAVVGVGFGRLRLSGAGVALHGPVVTGVGQGALPLAGGGVARHGVRGTGAGALRLGGVGQAIHPRYELRGEVRLAGVLVNRRVRAYLRSTGELLGQADTVAGQFRVHAGFAEAECTVTPIDLSDDATDWLPPTANRVLSVLAEDAAP